jgi:hypothetical protein
MTTDDDARARALEENRRRSKVMEEAQRHGPPAPRNLEREAALDLVASIFVRAERRMAALEVPEDDLE